MTPKRVQNINLKPKEEKSFTSKVKVPEDIKRGQFVGVIATEKLIKTESRRAAGLCSHVESQEYR